MRANLLKFACKFLFGVLLVGLLLWRIDLNLLVQNWLKLSWWCLLSVVGIRLGTYLVKAYKWHLLIPQVPYPRLCRIHLMSAYYAMLLPSQLSADAMRAYLLGRESEDTGLIVTSVLADKVTSLVGLFFLGCIGTVFGEYQLPVQWKLVMFFAFAVGIAAVFATRAGFVHASLVKTLAWAEARWSGFAPVFRALSKAVLDWHGFSERKAAMFGCMGLGVLHQLMAAVSLFVLGRSLGLPVSLLSWCWISCVLSAVLFLPVTIGGIGLRDGTLVGLLGWMGFGPEKALAMSLALLSAAALMAMLGALLVACGPVSHAGRETRGKTVVSKQD